MSVHQCPKCELRFNWKTELDDHCWHDHAEFRHDYPAALPPPSAPAAAAKAEPRQPNAPKHLRDNFVRWLVPRQPGTKPHTQHASTEPPAEQSDDPQS